MTLPQTVENPINTISIILNKNSTVIHFMYDKEIIAEEVVGSPLRENDSITISGFVGTLKTNV